MGYPYLTWLTEKKVPWERLPLSDQKSFSPYVLNRMLSGNRRFIDLVNVAQNASMSAEQVYRLYYYSLPCERIFLPFPAAAPKTQTPLALFLANRWQESTRHVTTYLTYYSAEEIIAMLAAYGLSDDSIIQLCQLKAKSTSRRSKDTGTKASRKSSKRP